MVQYQELYKKYRPRVFEEVVGQDNAINQIKTLILNDRVPTGIGFNAIHGSGKTTISKIIAKALNCENPIDKTTPCNKCQTCVAIDNNVQLGVVYISAANTGSVEDIRELVNKANLSYPVKKPVFIVDEIHNLSKAAFDALLIPLESEKMKTLFLFSTTEPDKVPPAVLSRIQNLTLPPVHWKVIARHLYSICQKEGISEEKITKEDLVACAKDSKGSVRNAIQNLETLLNSGKLPTSSTSQLIQAIVKGDTVELLKVTRQMNEDGANFVKTMENIFREFTTSLENIAGDTSIVSNESMLIAKETNGQFILKSLDILGEGVSSMKNKLVTPQVLFEIPLIKLSLMAKQFKK